MTPTKGYTEMKDSGIEWVGMIPKHWTTIANKYVMHKEKRICDKWDGQDVLSLTMNGVIIRDILNPVGKMPTTFDGYQFAYAGELLMCLFDIDVTPRCVGRVFNDGVTSPAYSCFQLHDNADLGYFYYYYLMVDNTKELLHLAKNLRHSFTEEQLGQLKVPLPPLQEQSAIAAYLDTQCSKIDEIIAQAKASIEDYKQWKVSIIYEAVTKGLNPNVEMKDSGIPWIGKIPAHWYIKVLFQLVSQVKNKNKNLSETNLLSLSYGKIKRKNIDDTDGLLPASFDGYNIIENNDIVLRLTDLQNDHTSLRVGRATERGIITSAYITVRPTNSRMSEYLYYLLHAFDIKKGFYGMGSGVRQGLNYDEIKMLKLPLPPLDEQSTIATYLDTQCAKIDDLIVEKQSLIDDLESYKKSLIYEVVTGKRRV